MPAVTVGSLSDETHRALKVRAARHGRSTEAEIRDILETAVRPAERVKLGSLVAAIGREAGGLTDEDIAHFERLRDAAPTGVQRPAIKRKRRRASAEDALRGTAAGQPSGKVLSMTRAKPAPAPPVADH